MRIPKEESQTTSSHSLSLYNDVLEATAKVLDNFDINLKHRFTTKLIWILFNEDTEKGVAGIILALFKSLQQKENTIRPLCAAAI